MSVKIKVKYFVDDLNRIEKLECGDWIDLRAAENVEMKQFEHELIPLGIAMKLPEGYEAHVLPRSSTFKKWGILMANSMGIIDETYCGNNDQWFFSAISMRDTKIAKGDRICQFRVMKKQPEIEFETVEFMEDADRGGHGSTGER